MAVIRIARQRFRLQCELDAFRALKRCGDRHLDTKLVWGMRLALVDALDLVSVQAVDLAAALALSLLQNGRGLVERPFEDRLELLFAGNLAGDVANRLAEIGPQLAQRLLARLNCLACA
jgi:hypothetical protein